MKILITSGGTEEPIDAVRYISNFSTGRTGAQLADRLNELGCDVTLLHGKKAILPKRDIELHSFTSFNDLNTLIKDQLGKTEYHAVIHLAAVSDFSVDYIENEKGERMEAMGKGKLSSENALTLKLKKNIKIIDHLKSYSKSSAHPLLIGYKLTDTDSKKEIEIAVKKLLKKGVVDFVVHNNLRDITKEKHEANFYNSSGDKIGKSHTKREMSDFIFSLLKGEQH